jgi:hypothetical protein
MRLLKQLAQRLAYQAARYAHRFAELAFRQASPGRVKTASSPGDFSPIHRTGAFV